MIARKVRLAIVCATLTLQASAHQAASTIRHTAKQPAVSSERLLEEAYRLGKEVPVEDRVWLLAELTMPSAKWHPALVRPWAEEQFRLAEQISGYNRLATQKNAATAMSWVDARRAFEMLEHAGFENKPEQARQMLNQSQQTMSSLKSKEEKLEILVAIAQSAASLQDFTLARQAVEKGLDLGVQVYEDSRKQHPDWPAYSWDGQDDMQKLAEIGTRLDVVHIVARIHAIQESLLQAYLLVSLSRGLDEGKWAAGEKNSGGELALGSPGWPVIWAS